MPKQRTYFWDRWFARVPGYEGARAFFATPIDPARPRYELARAYGLFIAGSVMVVCAVVTSVMPGVLFNVGFLCAVIGLVPLIRLANFGIGKLNWILVTLGLVLHFFDRPSLKIFGLVRPDWLIYVQLAIATGFALGLLIGTVRLAIAAVRTPIAAQDQSPLT